MKLHWLNYWMMAHAALFWVIIYFCIFKIIGYYEVEWATLFQWWWWNFFAYLYVAFMHYIMVNKKRLAPAIEQDEAVSI